MIWVDRYGRVVLDDVVIGDSVVVDSVFVVALIECGVLFWILIFDVALSVCFTLAGFFRHGSVCALYLFLAVQRTTLWSVYILYSWSHCRNIGCYAVHFLLLQFAVHFLLLQFAVHFLLLQFAAHFLLLQFLN